MLKILCPECLLQNIYIIAYRNIESKEKDIEGLL